MLEPLRVPTDETPMAPRFLQQADEDAYEARCLAWEQMTPEHVWGPAGDPTKTTTRKD
jgi:hypothetical protein